MRYNVQPTRVLIVDDEANVAVVLADSLEKLGEEFVFETAFSGDEALTKIKQGSYALVITDYKMPGMSGLDLAQAIRRLSPDTQVVLMTAYGTTELRDTAGYPELDGYIDKPFTMSQIREIVEHALKHATCQDPYRSGARAVEQPAYEHLQALYANTGARCVLLLSSSGYPVETVGETDELNVSIVGSLVAANFAAAAELARQFGNDSIFKSSYHEGTDYNIYAYDVNGELLLAVVFDSESKPGVVWFYTKQTAATMAPLVVEQATALESIGDLAAAMDAELEQAFGGESKSFNRGESTEGELFNMEEATARGVIPAELWDR